MHLANIVELFSALTKNRHIHSFKRLHVTLAGLRFAHL